MMPSTLRRGLPVVLGLMTWWLSGAVQAEVADDQLQPGRPALHYFAAHFATGVWSEGYPAFKCPVLGEVGRTKVAIFAKEPTTQTMHLASALDQAMQQYPQLRYSFLLVSEETPGVSMSDEELAARLDELRELAKQHDLDKLSMACLQPSKVITRWRNSLRFLNDADVVVAVIEPGISVPSGTKNQIRPGWAPTRTVKPYYRFAVRLKAEDIDRNSAEATIAAAIGSLIEPASIGLEPSGIQATEP